HMIDMGYDKGPDYLSDHPSLKSRLELARQRARELPPSASQWRRPDLVSAEQFRALQQRARDLGARLPDDKSLQQVQKLLAALPRRSLSSAKTWWASWLPKTIFSGRVSGRTRGLASPSRT